MREAVTEAAAADMYTEKTALTAQHVREYARNAADRFTEAYARTVVQISVFIRMRNIRIAAVTDAEDKKIL